MSDVFEIETTNISLQAVLNLAIDIWRIQRRARRDTSESSGVSVACERAVDTLHDIGIEIKELIGETYDENSLVHVIHEDGGPHNRVISECLSPAVYFQSKLIKKAEVIIKGEESDEQPNS